VLPRLDDKAAGLRCEGTPRPHIALGARVMHDDTKLPPTFRGGCPLAQYRPRGINAPLLARGIARHRASMRAAMRDDAWWLGLAWSAYFAQ
jgi:hypothetical protein